MLAQLQTIAGYPGSQPVCRIPVGGDVGTPSSSSTWTWACPTCWCRPSIRAEQAQALVQSLPLPTPRAYAAWGVRGRRAGAGIRGMRWKRTTQVCLLVQAETRLALSNLDAIAALDGVDGVFIGPADLSASMGHVGNPAHPEVQAAIEDAIGRIRKAGKAPGILTADVALARRYLELGALFVAVGLDTQILARNTVALAAKFKSDCTCQASCSIDLRLIGSMTSLTDTLRGPASRANC
jgi:4-hydroxy-2-oxoheptanedioate aldolase